jgi:hypothetical protein
MEGLNAIFCRFSLLPTPPKKSVELTQHREKPTGFPPIHSFVENPVGNPCMLGSLACRQGRAQPFA